ncbi:calmodulin-binding protein-like protein Sha1 [Lojkania enalia]|uniref:Calmodulin-binding protein-like protein Sha1 n=1 Tax=Lojkania enalia TaxID=147567 RepID=A0A9P4KHF9_9PLEO|nr:calmodulin-binding protein-like protein Sha1 [Didymosphaeria enalia]
MVVERTMSCRAIALPRQYRGADDKQGIGRVCAGANGLRPKLLPTLQLPTPFACCRSSHHIEDNEMRRHAEATPCPASNASFYSNRCPQVGRRSSIHAAGYSTDDTTTNLDYTTELRPSLRNAKPRRPMRGAPKSAFNPSLDIFEDVAQEEEQQHQAREVNRKSRASIMPEGALGKSTILAHPAQKVLVPAPVVHEPQLRKPHRRRVSQLLMDRQTAEANATLILQEHVLEKNDLKKQGPRKDPRRRTIYIPPDETTVVTIHPGLPTQKHRNPREKSPDIGLDLVTLSEEEPGNLVPALKKDKKAPRKSLAMPPKRAPLRDTSRMLQSVSFAKDVFGQGGGKENIPPGMEAIDIKCHPMDGLSASSLQEQKKPATKPARVHFTTSKSVETASQTKPKSESTHKRLRSQLSYDGSPAKSMKANVDGTASTSRKTEPKATTKGRVPRVSCAPPSSSPFHTDRSPPTALRRRRLAQAPTTISVLHVVGKPQEPKEKYPVLSEDLTRPELYEDHWLTYQEIAITQLLNSLFKSTENDPKKEQSPENLRKKMLAIYQDAAIPLLHKRLQASLLYGALSLPKDLLAQTLRLKDDVGLRKKFLNLWVKTYDLTALRVAAETIVGRQITVPSRLSSGSTSSDDGSRQFRSERRAIESFLDTFLIRNEDAVRIKSGGGSIASITRGDHNGEDFGSQGWAWRRTVLRSLMLVLVLDKAKTMDIFPSCLFQTSSPYKSSTDVLHSLANMLFPSFGDVTRPLGHLNYKVDHVQYPLQEYNYDIDNIAIDLRDGIILTRLVELLLYPPATLIAQHEETITITMPTGEILTSTFDFDQKESWVLSQHLKYPSIGRAQKLYNVQIALSALTGVRGIPVQAVGGVKPEDIVDGHREKTLSLLWALVGTCALSTLVDWPQLVKEIERFRNLWYDYRDNCKQRDLDSDDDDRTSELDGFKYHKRLLLSWARSIARLHGLRVSNLTTSFSEPKVLETIVDTYLPSSLCPSTSIGIGHLSLATKLKATGCSTSFISLFTPQVCSKTIPSKDFTLLSLSFLASRLLPLSITHRAASTIQRAYRRRLAWKTVHKRVVLMRLAADCAVVAQARERLVNAATVIQRRWKIVLESRRVQLTADVELFQALARGWAIRRWVRRVSGGRIGGKEKVRRMRGGW